MALKLVSFGLPAAIAIGGVALVAFGGDFSQGVGVVLLVVALFLALVYRHIHRGLVSQRGKDCGPRQ